MERVERALCGARGVRGEVRRSADDDDDDKRPDTLSFGVCRAPFGLPCGRANVGREAVRVAVEGSALSRDAVLMLSESCEWRSLGLVCGDTAFIVAVVVAVDIDVVDVTGADSRRAARGCGGDTCTRTGDTGGASASVLTRNSTPVQSASSQPPRPLLLPAPLLLRLSKRPLVCNDDDDGDDAAEVTVVAADERNDDSSACVRSVANASAKWRNDGRSAGSQARHWRMVSTRSALSARTLALNVGRRRLFTTPLATSIDLRAAYGSSYSGCTISNKVTPNAHTSCLPLTIRLRKLSGDIHFNGLN
mmetsp:Transcript_21252/g.36236  ORF Transcript_21252/g.36236 Transcript_21252/m.36236 type:complete len:305 (+) Transcript_21252:1591-2505(+)